MDITEYLFRDKKEILNYFRRKSEIKYNEIQNSHIISDQKKNASIINRDIACISSNLKSAIINASSKWSKNNLLNNILMITYCSYVVMIEYRNKVWPYEYMTFSRRIGELWDPFCRICFENTVRENLQMVSPKKFEEVAMDLKQEMNDYLNTMAINNEEKYKLLDLYEKVWSLLTSGEIKLELDLHFKKDDIYYHVDFKSGFQSNEKGNTNRLLLVANIYKNILKTKNKCLLFVRSNECDNNHYLKTLINSNLWDVYCGNDTYEKIYEFTGFNLKDWISQYIHWDEDFTAETYKYLIDNNLTKYLTW
ncbi:hypothetical protein [uncultured Akkermansia sp.]|jgi:hypothetical protein|uniref:hypothetical protein n=1 Tax=uncultured Akkermansia sp. TaxID=512294 RepID=UPI002595FDB2|nr:hypothetical protein [uncultured Akkermansia sp.]